MHVPTKGESVYQQEFKWQNRRGQEAQEPSRVAGYPTNLAQDRTHEPPIARKKRVDSAPSATVKISASNGSLYSGGEPYMLLGQQEKFAHNVAYKAKRKIQEKTVIHPPEPAVTTPDAPREQKPAPRVVYDTGAPKPAATEMNGHVSRATESSKKKDKAAMTDQVEERDAYEKALDKARQAVAVVEIREALTELKSFNNPPELVKTLVEAICVLLGILPLRTNCPKTGNEVDDYWRVGKKFLGESNSVEKLRNLDIENIPRFIARRIQENYLSRPEFNPHEMACRSFAARNMCMWLRAVVEYRLLMKPKPKRPIVARRRSADTADEDISHHESTFCIEENVEAQNDKLNGDAGDSDWLQSVTVETGTSRCNKRAAALYQRRDKLSHMNLPASKKDVPVWDRAQYDQMLKDANEECMKLPKQCIVALRALSNPPHDVKSITECLCALLGLKATRKLVDSSRYVYDYWPPAVKALARFDLYNTLMDVDSIPRQNIENMRRKLAAYQNLNSISLMAKMKEAAQLWMYLHAVDRYDRLKKQEFFHPPPAPKEPTVKASLAPKPAHSAHHKANAAQKPVEARKKEATSKTPAPKQSEGKPKDRRGERRGQMNEFAQADLDRGVVDSGQEAPANFALQYRHGVAPARSHGPKRQSEYNMQFTWKKGITSSPLLAAEQRIFNAVARSPSVSSSQSCYNSQATSPVPSSQDSSIVYKSNPSAPPFRPDTMKKHSEYATQFQAWQNLGKSTPSLVDELRQDKIERASPNKLRSKSVEDLHLDKRPAAGTQPVTSPEDKRFVQETMNPQKLHLPHGKQRCNSAHQFEERKQRSEYQSNYKSPQKFSYDSGAWKGADLAHLVHRAESSAASEAAPPAPRQVAASADAALSATGGGAQTWFREVMELRSRAKEYKRRALGTHFSRQHVGQLYAPQEARLWDDEDPDVGQGHGEPEAVSEPDPGSDVLSALNLEVASQASGSRRASSVASSRVSKKHAWTTASLGSATPVSQRAASPDVDDYAEEDYDTPRAVSPPAPAAKRPASAPTAKGQRSHGATKLVQTLKKSSATRHHLDRTTPNKGALLTGTRQDDQASVASETRIPPQSLGATKTVGGKTTSGQTKHTASAQVRCTCGADLDPRSVPPVDPSVPPVDPSTFTARESGRTDSLDSLAAQASCTKIFSKPPSVSKAPEGIVSFHDRSCEMYNPPKDEALFHTINATRKSSVDVKKRHWGQDGNTIERIISPDHPNSQRQSKGNLTHKVGNESASTYKNKVDKAVQIRRSPTCSIRKPLQGTLGPIPVDTSAHSTKQQGQSTSMQDTMYHPSPATQNTHYNYAQPPVATDGSKIAAAPTAQGNRSDLEGFRRRFEELQKQIAQSRGQNSSGVSDQSPERGNIGIDQSGFPNQESHSPAAAPHGMPTRDSHVLLDEDAASDHTMPTTFVHNPANPNPALKLGTLREEASDTYKVKTRSRPFTSADLPLVEQAILPEDARRVSTLSVASNCSLASQTLERARVRRDNFWGTSPSVQ